MLFAQADPPDFVRGDLRRVLSNLLLERFDARIRQGPCFQFRQHFPPAIRRQNEQPIFGTDRPRNNREFCIRIARSPFRRKHNSSAAVNSVSEMAGVIDLFRRLCAIFQNALSPAIYRFLPFCTFFYPSASTTFFLIFFVIGIYEAADFVVNGAT